MRLDGRVVIVTGAAGGIGGGIVEALLDEGARTLMTDCDGERLTAAQHRLDPSGEGTAAMVADLADEHVPEAIVNAAVTRFGRLDGLVNNAGVIAMDAAIDAERAEWTHHLDINLVAPFALAQATARHLRTHGGGSIVNVCRTAARSDMPTWPRTTPRRRE